MYLLTCSGRAKNVTVNFFKLKSGAFSTFSYNPSQLKQQPVLSKMSAGRVENVSGLDSETTETLITCRGCGKQGFTDTGLNNGPDNSGTPIVGKCGHTVCLNCLCVRAFYVDWLFQCKLYCKCPLSYRTVDKSFHLD
jgi:hypothetical protein